MGGGDRATGCDATSDKGAAMISTDVRQPRQSLTPWLWTCYRISRSAANSQCCEPHQTVQNDDTVWEGQKMKESDGLCMAFKENWSAQHSRSAQIS